VPLVTTFGGKDAGSHLQIGLFAPLYRAVFEISERIVCVSSALARQVVDRGADPERVVVIHRGTDLDFFQALDRSQRPDRGPLRLLMVGRLVEKKGHSYAMQALQSLQKDGTDVRLKVVGQGEDLQALRRLSRELGVAQFVDFAGSTDEAGLREQYRWADILLHPSVTAADGDVEGLPNTIVEAAATGLPVIATRHGGIPEAVLDDNTGLLVDERDVKGIATAIRTLARDRERRLAMGRSAADNAETHFDLSRQVDRHVELYRELVDEHPPDAPRMRRTYIDATYFEAFRSAIHLDPDDTIFSQLEKISWSWPRGGRTPAFKGPSPSQLANVRQLGVRVPEPIRRLARRSLTSLANAVARARSRRRGGDILSSGHDLNTAVLDFVKTGGAVDEIDPDWSVERLSQFLRGRRSDMGNGTQPNADSGADPE
jgi:hypothetical protein